jgi:glutamate formiminotransferase/formiminotetrahydrofolate cyclodeaminase
VTASRQAATSGRLEQLPFGSLLDALEAPAPSPCGGSAAALAGAMAASLVRLVAHRAPDWVEAPGVAAQAGVLRARLLQLAEDDVRAYAAAMEALAAAREAGGGRDHLIGVALERAAEVPLAVAAAAADVAELAAEASKHGSPALRPDATTAALLAEAASRSSARLVEVNLAMLEGDPRERDARASAAAAARARERALEEHP